MLRALILFKPNLVLVTVRKNSDDLRCARELITAIRKATKDCVLCVAEVPVGTQSARAAWSLGIALCTLGTIDKPLIEVTPSEVKLSTVGKKTASKTEMIGWAMDQHPRLDWKVRKVKGVFKPVAANEHMADAIAAIYAGVYSEQFKQFVAAFNSIRNSNE